MADRGIMIPSKVAAHNIDSLVRSAKSSADLDNGNVVSLTALTGTSGEGEVWTAATPATGATLTNLWMVGEPEVVLTDSKYKGIDPNIKAFYNVAGKVFTAFKLQLGDIVMLSADALGGTKSTNTFVVATNGTVELTWASAAVSGVSLKLLATEYVSAPSTGAIGESQRVDMYKFEVVAIA
jgi:hypothetical protein